MVFKDYFRAWTLPNIVAFIVLALFSIYFGNFLLNQFFGTKILPLGQPLQFLLIGMGLLIAFYVVIKRQGALDRSDIISLLIIGGSITALIYYLPVLIPDIYSIAPINAAYTNTNSPIHILYNVSSTIHSGIQSVIPIP